jgi:DNA-directed RNA polymerase sigma subunit (sigma70/sigma32)
VNRKQGSTQLTINTKIKMTEQNLKEQSESEYIDKKRTEEQLHRARMDGSEQKPVSQSLAQDCCAAREDAKSALRRLIERHVRLVDKAVKSHVDNIQAVEDLNALAECLPTKLTAQAERGLYRLVAQAKTEPIFLQ